MEPDAITPCDISVQSIQTSAAVCSPGGAAGTAQQRHDTKTAILSLRYAFVSSFCFHAN